MSGYIGQEPVFGDFPFKVITADGSAAYDATFKASSANGVLVFLDGAIQRPVIDYSFSGTVVTFAFNVPEGTQILLYGLGLPKTTIAPNQGSVTYESLSPEMSLRLPIVSNRVPTVDDEGVEGSVWLVYEE